MYERIDPATPTAFWGKHGQRIDWMTPYTKRQEHLLRARDTVSIKWYEDGFTNVSTNCIDRHLAKRGDQVAIIWEGDDPGGVASTHHLQGTARATSAASPTSEDRRASKKGDAVTIYMPMIPEAAYAMLACARIGAVHSIVFGGFSPDALAGRIEGCESKVLITADEGLRGSKKVPLKANADAAIDEIRHGVETVIVVKPHRRQGRR